MTEANKLSLEDREYVESLLAQEDIESVLYSLVSKIRDLEIKKHSYCQGWRDCARMKEVKK
jgi:hypothetical protein